MYSVSALKPVIEQLGVSEDVVVAQALTTASPSIRRITWYASVGTPPVSRGTCHWTDTTSPATGTPVMSLGGEGRVTRSVVAVIELLREDSPAAFVAVTTHSYAVVCSRPPTVVLPYTVSASLQEEACQASKSTHTSSITEPFENTLYTENPDKATPPKSSGAAQDNDAAPPVTPGEPAMAGSVGGLGGEGTVVVARSGGENVDGGKQDQTAGPCGTLHFEKYTKA